MILFGLLALFALTFIAYGEEAHDQKDTWIDALMRVRKCRGITTADRMN